MNIGMISTRFAGTDGVSLETAKLATILAREGHDIFYCAGELDPTLPGLEAPELHFVDPTAVALGQRAFGSGETGVDTLLLADIDDRAATLERPLQAFLEQYDIDYVIVQNAFAIPMQLPLAQALTNVLAASGLPGLAHNHDYYWERVRFDRHRLGDFLDTYFPPDLPRLRHASINSLAQQSLRQQRGLDSLVLPNVFDFATPAPGIDDYSADFRSATGVSDDDWLILQPTRVIPRKGIELSIELLARLEDPRAKLVITHHAGDEGLDYLKHLQALAVSRGVDLRYVADIVGDTRGETAAGGKLYSLWDTYPHADLVAYPSLVEGFGNALVEAIYFRRPALVNRYAVYAADIGPLGFHFAEIDGALTAEAVAQVRGWLAEPETAVAAVEHNYQLGERHFSYRALKELLLPLLDS